MTHWIQWTMIRNALVPFASGRFVVSQEMTVADIEAKLRNFTSDLSVAGALEWLEYQKTFG